MSQDYKAGKSSMSSPFTAKGSTGQMIPEMGNFMHTSKATLVPYGYDSVKKKKNT